MMLRTIHATTELDRCEGISFRLVTKIASVVPSPRYTRPEGAILRAARKGKGSSGKCTGEHL